MSQDNTADGLLMAGDDESAIGEETSPAGNPSDAEEALPKWESTPVSTQTEAAIPPINDQALQEQQKQIKWLKQHVTQLEKRVKAAEEATPRLSASRESSIPALPNPPQSERGERPKRKSEFPRSKVKSLCSTLNSRLLPFNRPYCPPPCESASLVFSGSVAIHFGGTNGSDLLNDVWAFDATAEKWRKMITTNTPLGRCEHSAVTYKNKMYIYGGFGCSETAVLRSQEDMAAGKKWVSTNNGYSPMGTALLDSLWCLDITASAWERVQCSAYNHFVKGHAACVANGLMYTFGGINQSGRTNVMLALDLKGFFWTNSETWNPQLLAELMNREPNAAIPPPCSGHTMSSYTQHQKTYFIVFGGRTSSRSFSNDIFIYSLDTQYWGKMQCSGDLPPPRAGHSAVVYKGYLFIFGGYSYILNAKQYFNDIYMLNLTDFQWKKAQITGTHFPYGRCEHVAALYEALDGSIRMLVHGGWGEGLLGKEHAAMISAGRTEREAVVNVEGAIPSMSADYYTCNNDTFSITLALPCAAKVEVAPRKTVSQESTPRTSPRNAKGQKPPWSVPTTQCSIPPITPSPRKADTVKLPWTTIESSVMRLSDVQRLQREKERLEKKYGFHSEQERNQLTMDEQLESIDRLYYQHVDSKEERDSEMDKKWCKREEGRVLDEEEWFELVERLTQRPTKELQGEDTDTSRKFINDEGVKNIIYRLYVKQKEVSESARRHLQEKYTPSIRKIVLSKGEIENSVLRLYENRIADFEPKTSPKSR